MSLLDCGFGSEYELSLSAWGEGELNEESLLSFQRLDAVFEKFREQFHRNPKEISLLIQDSMACGCDYGFTGVDSAFLEKLENLKELILPDSIKDICMTPKLEKIFKENNTLIRGTFGSFAESFAEKNNLNFRHSDYDFACHVIESVSESTVLTLVFNRDGSVIIKESVNSPGISAGNCLGGTLYHKLRKDFYKKKTASEIAGME